jgi:peroxiredoxin
LQTASKTAPNSEAAHRELASVDLRLHLANEATHERAMANHLHDLAEAQSPAPGPKRNEPAPDFALPNVSTGKSVSLRDFRGKSPVVLIFGSYTCPNFRTSSDALKTLQSKYGAKAPFLLIYIREAHGAGDWQSTRNERENIDLPQAQVLSDKREHAVMCSRALHLPFPALLDGLDNKVEAAYAAWPSRAFVIDREGRIRYSSRLTELDFSAAEMEAALQKVF